MIHRGLAPRCFVCLPQIALVKASPMSTRYAPDWPLSTSPLRFFDLETTGLRPDRGARITEIAVLGQDTWHVAWSRIHETRKPTPELQSALNDTVTHLTEGIVVGHNLSFDFKFMAYEAERLALPLPSLYYIDTLAVARAHLTLSDMRLTTCCHALECAPDVAFHTAQGDVQATRALLWALAKRCDLQTLADAGIQRMHWGT